MGQYVLYSNGTEYHCPGWATFSGNIFVEIFAIYPNNNENFGNKKDEFENEYDNDLDLLFLIKNIDLRTTLCHHEMEFTTQKAIDIVTSKKLIPSEILKS